MKLPSSGTAPTDPELGADEGASLVAGLEAAWRPGELAPATLERLLAAGLSSESPADPAPGPAPELDALAAALRAAHTPGEPAHLEELLAGLSALPPPEWAAEAPERHDAERLRQALEGGGEHPYAALAHALAAAARPQPLAEDQLERLLAARRPRRRVSQLALVGVGVVTGALALAAAIALWVRPTSSSEERLDLAQQGAQRSRSTAPLFVEQFEVGRVSERLDEIQRARERDYRSNRYAQWGLP